MQKLKFVLILLIASFLLSSAAYADDTYYSKQWYLDSIKAPDAWKITKGSEAVVVAVIDTGVDIRNPDLAGNIWVNSDEIPNNKIDDDRNGFIDDINGWNFVEDVADPTPVVTTGYNSEAISHGTFIAGLISAKHDNNYGIKGITDKVKIMGLRGLDSKGIGDSETVSKAINYAIDNGAQIINLSFGGTDKNGELKAAIENANRWGILVVAAAGNGAAGKNGTDMTKHPYYPVCYDQKSDENKNLGVLATDRNNRVASFTNYGTGCIDLGAPGQDITSLAYYNSSKSDLNKYVVEGWNGSSFAAGLVSGAAALLKSVDMTLKPSQIIELLTQESGLLALTPEYKDKAGNGLLNIYKVLAKLKGIVASSPTAANSSSANVAPVISGGKRKIFFSKLFGASADVFPFDQNAKAMSALNVFSGDKFTGLNMKTVDYNKDGVKEIVLGANAGSQPFVRAINQAGELLASFMAFDSNFKGGVNVSAGDLDNDGKTEFVVAPEKDYKPIVKIFNSEGKLQKELLVYNENYKGGLEVDVADVDGDKKDEIIVAPHAGIMAKIKVYDKNGKMKFSFLPFDAKNNGGVNLSAGDFNRDGRVDIVASSMSSALVKIFDYNARELAGLTAYPGSFTIGVTAVIGDWNNDGNMEILTAPGKGGGPHVKIFTSAGKLLQEFFPFSNGFTKGIDIGVE